MTPTSAVDASAEGTLSYLRPEVVAKLATMELRAHLVVEGFMAGLHRSPYHGFSNEFTEHRPYMQGDDIKRIDWKAYGKTERYYIKQYEDETNLRTTLIVDASASMGFSSEGRPSKLNYACMTAAALSYIMVKQRDAVGLIMFDEALRTSIPPHSTRSHLKLLWKELEQAQPGKATKTANVLHNVAETLKRRGLVILLSDLFDEPAEVLNALKHFRHKGHEVLVFQVLDPVERSFAFPQEARFKDMESGEELTAHPWHVQNTYRDAMKDFLETYRRECREHSIEHTLLDTATPFDVALSEFLHLRSRLH